tara:strand:+ start:289 stop:483 length:195 start_codon:yes stop_codon:yes gene_type:complete
MTKQEAYNVVHTIAVSSPVATAFCDINCLQINDVVDKIIGAIEIENITRKNVEDLIQHWILEHK